MINAASAHWPSVGIACGVRRPARATTSTSVALLLNATGSATFAGGVTPAVFATLPDADASIDTDNIYVIAAPFFIVTVVLRLPEPLAAPHAVVTLPPAPGLVTLHVQLVNVVPAGATSTMLAFVTSSGPKFVTVIA